MTDTLLCGFCLETKEVTNAGETIRCQTVGAAESLEDVRIQSVLQTFIVPEVIRRGWHLSNMNIAQIISSETGISIRLNDEVYAQYIALLKQHIDRCNGDIIYVDEIEDIESVELTDLDLNVAHITLFHFQNRWKMFFDFRYNRQRCKEHLDSAQEFLDDSKCVKGCRTHCDLLMVAAENVAKALLLSSPRQKMWNCKKHKTISSELNINAKFGNIKQEFVNVYNELRNNYDDARYTIKELIYDREYTYSVVQRFLEETRIQCLKS